MLTRIAAEQRAVIGLALVAAFGEAAYAIINVLALPVFVEKRLDATTSLGLIISFFLLGEGLFKGPMGALGDRVGRRIMLILAPLGSALAVLCLTRVHPPLTWSMLALVLLIRFVDGIAAAGLWTTMYAAVADHVPEERRASANSTLTVSYLVGIALGPWLGGIAARRYSIVASFYLVAGLFLFTSLTALLATPRHEPHHAHHEAGEGKVSWAGFVESLRRLPGILAVALIVFFGIGLLTPIATLLALHEFHLDEEQFGALFRIPAVVIGVLSLLLGRLGDRWGAHRSVHLGMGVAALSLWAMASLPKTEALLVLGASALGVGFVVGLPAWLTIVAGLADAQHRGALIGAVSTAQSIGAGVGALLGPVLFKASGLAHTLNPIWPGEALSPHLLPVIAAAMALTVAWLASLVMLRHKNPVMT
jgi:MFS family permease